MVLWTINYYGKSIQTSVIKSRRHLGMASRKSVETSNSNSAPRYTLFLWSSICIPNFFVHRSQITDPCTKKLGMQIELHRNIVYRGAELLLLVSTLFLLAIPKCLLIFKENFYYTSIICEHVNAQSNTHWRGEKHLHTYVKYMITRSASAAHTHGYVQYTPARPPRGGERTSTTHDKAQGTYILSNAIYSSTIP